MIHPSRKPRSRVADKLRETKKIAQLCKTIAENFETPSDSRRLQALKNRRKKTRIRIRAGEVRRKKRSTSTRAKKEQRTKHQRSSTWPPRRRLLPGDKLIRRTDGLDRCQSREVLSRVRRRSFCFSVSNAARRTRVGERCIYALARREIER